jgi:soluble lytic murein transglycosylase-like protein
VNTAREHNSILRVPGPAGLADRLRIGYERRMTASTLSRAASADRRLARWLFAVSILTAAVFAQPVGPGARAAEAPPVAVPAVPEPLGAEDALRYRQVFALQKAGRWRAADKVIKAIEDTTLMGHVLAQRYLHPTRYRTRFKELKEWMALYADHPDAKRLWRLAMKRKPRGARAPVKPRYIVRKLRRRASDDEVRAAVGRPRGRAERRLMRRIARNVFRQRLTTSERLLADRRAVRRVSAAGIDRARALIASGWFRRGQDAYAFALADKAAERSGEAVPLTHWWAGLAAFRLGRYADAARHFEAMSSARYLGARRAAAADFWAARSRLVGGEPEKVLALLERAATNPFTFYGRLAGQILGRPAPFAWHDAATLEKDIKVLEATASGRRAFSLIQVGEARRAEREFRVIRAGAPAAALRSIVAISSATGLPATQLRAARVLLAITGERHDSALYPVPLWTPSGGYSIDRALVFALARQESGFNSRAKSRSGARGLMQLMPATARYMAGSRRQFRGRARSRLFDPSVNLALGQKYVDYLLAGDVVGGNLVLMIAAYNGGPGNLAKWQRSVAHGADPLVFIETIPLSETRLFVKRVLENLWAYRARLGQPAPSLTALAGGTWPAYVGLDGTPARVAEQRR